MASGLPYDSDAGRDYAACVTAIMCGEAYLQSSKIAELCQPLSPATEPHRISAKNRSSRPRLVMTIQPFPGGACPGWYINREPFLDVIRMHRASVNNINRTNVPAALYEASKETWDEALKHGEKFGYRNAQVTVLAPTGTIGFMMDCDTTGIEPDLALVKYKKLVGGGMIKIVNNTVPTALFKLGYTSDQTNAIVSYIDATGTIEGAPAINDEHLAVFDCSFKPTKGTRTIHYMGHVRMMAAAQPFISGAISKTINMPENATVEEISEAYIQSWKLGLKAVAIYRDGSKKAQPLSSMGSATAKSGRAGLQAGVEGAGSNESGLQPAAPIDEQAAPPKAIRHRLPEERLSITHKFSVGGHEGYLTVGLYKDGVPGEIFITMAKEGSTISGLMDSFACAVSIGLQHGVPLKLLCEKFAHTRFEPSRLERQPGHRLRQVDHGLRFPLAAAALPHRTAAGALRRTASQVRQRSAGGHTRPGRPEVVRRLHRAGKQVGRHPERRRCCFLVRFVLPDGALFRIVIPRRRRGIGGCPIGRFWRTGWRGAHHHASDALKDLIDLGDSPSCHVCGAIMTRNGSCYRCMSCGSTSGCS